MKLWTVQEKEILTTTGNFIYCTRPAEESYWRISYEFMARYYEQLKNVHLKYPLIWAWSDGNFFSNEDHQLDAVSTVESSVEYLSSKCVINLEVPDNIPVLSSYSKWNRLMEYCMTFNKAPTSLEDWEGLFDLLDIAEHEFIQAVLPHIDRNWISGVEELNFNYFNE